MGEDPRGEPTTSRSDRNADLGRSFRDFGIASVVLGGLCSGLRVVSPKRGSALGDL
jgi:hypothetical protein